MSQYTTGDLAKLCNVTVRTVQFYDKKDLLKPSELTEGGRRIYSDDDLKKLRLICLLKSLGFSLEAIKGTLESKSPEKVLLMLLDDQQKMIDLEIKDKQRQSQAIRIVKECIQSTKSIPTQAISDIEHMMKSKKKMRRTHSAMVAVSITIVLLFFLWQGVWEALWLFLPVWAFRLTQMSNSTYICAECAAVFKPSILQKLFTLHTSKIRKLKCPKCKNVSFCIETLKLH